MLAAPQRSVRQMEFAARVRAEIERNLHTWSFQYITLSDAEVLHVISIGWCGWVAVIGNGADGSYEWVRRPDGATNAEPRQPLVHSNLGYGCPESALRDALNEALGD